MGLFLFVISSTAAARDVTEEKINDTDSVASYLPQFSFDPFTSFPEMSSIDGNINLKIDLVLNLFPFTDNISRKRVILQLFQ